MIDADFHEIETLIAQIDGAGVRAAHDIAAELNDVGREIRDDARQFAPGAHGGVARHYPATITHEIVDGGTAVEIGPEKGGQGSLGHIFEYGTAHSAPQAHLGPALDRSEPTLAPRLAEAASRSLL
jgi:hypothetical protein